MKTDSSRLHRHLLAALAIALSLIPVAAEALERNAPERWAVLFIDPNLRPSSGYSFLERVSMTPKIAYERGWYEYNGYDTYIAYADDETIKRALLDPRVKAISYFGHGGGIGQPTLGHGNAQIWRGIIFQELLRHYSQFLPQQQAYQLADRESRNFGLDSTSNHSCRSLVDDSMAKQFVRQGGSYYGVTADRYAPCDITAIMSSNRDALLTELRVGVPTPPPVPMPTPVLPRQDHAAPLFQSTPRPAPAPVPQPTPSDRDRAEPLFESTPRPSYPR